MVVDKTVTDSSTDKDTEVLSSLSLVPRKENPNRAFPFTASLLNPSLGQTIWLDTDYLVRTFDAPSDVAPFLGDGMFTIAGCLYWACVTYTVSLWEEADKLGSTGRLDPRPLDRIFTHSKHLTDRAFLAALARARLEYRRKGMRACKSSVDGPAERNRILALPLLVRQEYEAKGQRVEWWKRPQDVEDYVRRHLSPGDVEALQAVAEGRAFCTGFEKFRSLIGSLAQDYVCFGDGPRWNALHVSLTVGGWLEKHQALQAA